MRHQIVFYLSIFSFMSDNVGSFSPYTFGHLGELGSRWWRHPHRPDPAYHSSLLRLELAAKKEGYKGDESVEEKNNNNNPLLQASWYAVEAFGKAFGRKTLAKTDATTTANLPAIDTSVPPSSLEETFQRLQMDNDREYFLSGRVDTLIYDPDCAFADPFVSFQGRDRFVENLANLGSFITEYSARPLSYEEMRPNEMITEENSKENNKAQVTTKFMVKLRLNLPWKPVLAWPWGVRCEIDPLTYQIVLHEESWDIDPWEVRIISFTTMF